MVFVGDIAIPKMKNINYSWGKEIFKDKILIANLEGAFTTGKEKLTKLRKEKKLFNIPETVNYLKSINTEIVSLANNHIFDISDDIGFTQKILEENNISYLGAGNSLAEASRKVYRKIDNKIIAFFSYGWDVIGCRRAGDKTGGVNCLDPQRVVDEIKTELKINPEILTVVMFHWNYELELYPQPMFRELARDLIDLGVKLIIGHHSHCAEGIEFYKGRPIVYSLGNWLLPGGEFWDGKLKFPAISETELAFEWDIKNDQFFCHWFHYDQASGQLKFQNTEKASESELIKNLTPFRDFSSKKYIKWFRKNRRKKKLLPVYKNYKNSLANKMKDNFVFARAKLINLLMVLKIKSHPN